MAQPALSSSVQPTDIYGGDEVSAIVLDPGYCHTRAGFAGEDVPKCVMPSSYAHIAADPSNPSSTDRALFGDEVLYPRAGLELRNYMNRDSTVEDWEGAEKIWEHMLVNRLQPPRPTPTLRNGLNDPADKDGDVSMDDGADDDEQGPYDPNRPLAEFPLLMTEASWNQPKDRERAIELAMEKWGVPAFWLIRTPVVAAFAAGKPTALVVDVGGAGTNVAAVHDGMVLKRSVQRSPVGGIWLSHQIRAMWEQNDPKVDIVPTFMVENKTAVDAGTPANARLRHFPFAIHDSFRRYEEERLLTEFKESVVETWHGPGKYLAPGNEDYVKSQPGRVFEMPDGANQMWREQRFRVSEGFWDETAAYETPALDGSGGMEKITKAQTIPELIKASLSGVDVDLRPNLLQNVVVTGSTSLINGFNDRINAELQASFSGLRIKLHSAGLTTERRFGAWIGASILGSLGTFHQMWISRKEYEENGSAIVEKRCK